MTQQPEGVRYRNPYLYFGVANLIALMAGGGIFLFFLSADFLNAPIAWFNEFLFEHKGLAVITAVSPLLAGGLVGFGYASRARKRRLAQAVAADETA